MGRKVVISLNTLVLEYFRKSNEDLNKVVNELLMEYIKKTPL
jgi:hypothetical protein